MNRLSTTITNLMVALLIVACQERNITPVVETPQPEPTHEEPTYDKPKNIEEDLQLNQFSVEVENEPYPCKYKVAIRWSPTQTPIAWVINRAVDNSTTKHLVTLEPATLEYTDDDVQCGKTYSYGLGVIGSSSFRTVKTFDVTIPVDLEINKTETALRKITDYNRLFIAQTGKLLTNGESLEINVNEIISDGGAIESFPEGQTASLGVAGRTGAHISITAKRGQGELFIYARGENGGVGAAGASGAQGPKGGRGHNALCGNRQAEDGLPENEAKLCRPEVYQQLVRGSQSNFPTVANAHRHVLNAYYCKVATGNGGTGGQGHPGAKGCAGSPGGASSQLYVHIEEPSNIKITPYSLPGTGGPGGNGGAGGPGGPGGDPGSRDAIPICAPGAHGATGPVGANGPQGDSGLSGKSQPICVQVGPATYGECQFFEEKGV